MPAREPLLSRTFVQLADSLVDEFDLIELLTLLSHRCVDLFQAGAAGILLADQRGNLQVVAASTEQARLLELFQLQNDEGPCLECFSTGVAITVQDLSSVGRWPLFAPEAWAAGYRGVCAFPLRLRDAVIGTLNIFMIDPVALEEQDLQICQALADVATIAILQQKAVKVAENLSEQLQHALDSRVAIEQAKGILAERFHLEMTDAFTRLRRFARSSNQRLSDVASAVVLGQVVLDPSNFAIATDPLADMDLPPDGGPSLE
jgi:transcriptional regulator with GAF, ATPase, and Fis domain